MRIANTRARKENDFLAIYGIKKNKEILDKREFTDPGHERCKRTRKTTQKDNFKRNEEQQLAVEWWLYGIDLTER